MAQTTKRALAASLKKLLSEKARGMSVRDEDKALPGGACDGIRDPNKGFIMRGGREMWRKIAAQDPFSGNVVTGGIVTCKDSPSARNLWPGRPSKRFRAPWWRNC